MSADAAAGPPSSTTSTQVVVVGAGLAGLVATCELLDAGRRVVLLDQESAANLGGQAHWSFGGLFLIDSPEQRRLRIRDSVELAWSDWIGTAGFDRPEDHWPRQWARAYVEWAAGEKRDWLRSRGVSFFPVVGWAERGDGRADGHGNSVPRFHITWGTGPGLLAPFVAQVEQARRDGRLEVRCRHRMEEVLLGPGGARVVGVRGTVLAPDEAPRGRATSREVVGDFEIRADAVVLTSGGIGGNHDLVRSAWPPRLGAPPRDLLTGVPAYVDGSGLQAARRAGAHLINSDRMWHYVEGVQNWDPIWPGHGIRILPGPSSLWLDAHGRRLPPPLFPGFDTLGTLAHLRTAPGGDQARDWSWFVTTKRILEKEFTLSGSEQNPDLTGRDAAAVLRRAGAGVPEPVLNFVRHGPDWLTARTLPQLVAAMNALTGEDLLDVELVTAQVVARDRAIEHPFGKDAQVTAVRGARSYLGDRLIRVATPHRLLDPAAGPLVAIRLRTLTRKTLGGLETDLRARVLRDPQVQQLPRDPQERPAAVIEGLYAAGEVAGFGGGGMHGYRSLEGTFLGGCLFSGRTAGRAAAADLG